MQSLPSKGCFTKTKIIEARNSCAVAENNHESASTVPEAEEMILAVEVETKLRKTRITITTTMKVKTLSSLLTTLSRSFKLAMIAFRSRPISTLLQSIAYSYEKAGDLPIDSSISSHDTSPLRSRSNI